MIETYLQPLANQISPVISIGVVVILALWFKSYVEMIAKGLMFKLGRKFAEGDIVLVDDEQAVIVKIGWTQTVFGIKKETGKYVWRYISNDRLTFAKLEKIVQFEEKDNDEQ